MLGCFFSPKMFEVAEGAQGSITSSHTFEPAHQDGVESLAVHGDVFYSSSRDCFIKKWDLATKQLLQVSRQLIKYIFRSRQKLKLTPFSTDFHSIMKEKPFH